MMLTILFLVAVLLAIPTTGLSLLAWLVLLFFVSRSKAKQRIAGLDHMRSTRAVIEPLIGGSNSDFYRAINVPVVYGKTRNSTMDEQCGRHILNYISHNPGLPEAFIAALKYQVGQSVASMPTAVEALSIESADGVGPMRYLCLTTISTLMQQNKLACFDGVDILALIEQEASMIAEFGETLDKAM